MLVSFLKVLNNRPVRISAHSKFKKLNKRPGILLLILSNLEYQPFIENKAINEK